MPEVAEKNQIGPGGRANPPLAEVVEALKNDLLTLCKAVVALEKRVNETAVNTADVRPQLLALKVHTESIPHALREVRRSDAAVQRAIADFDARLRVVEVKVHGAAAAG